MFLAEKELLPGEEVPEGTEGPVDPILRNALWKLPWVQEVAESGKIQRITKKNLENYRKILDPDVAADLIREGHKGLGLYRRRPETPDAVIAFALRHPEEAAYPETEILWFKAPEEKAAGQLLSAYGQALSGERLERSYFELPSLTEGEQAALRGEGFSIEHGESRDIVVSVRELMGLSFVRRRLSSYVTSIARLDEKQFRAGVANCMFYGKTGLLEDISSLPFSWYERMVSSCVLMDGKARGFLLVHKRPSGTLMVDLLFAAGATSRQDLIQMIRYSIRAAAARYPEDTKVLLRRHNGEVWELVARLFPDKAGERVLSGKKK